MLFLILFKLCCFFKIRDKKCVMFRLYRLLDDTHGILCLIFPENSSMVSQLLSSAADVIGALTLSFMNIHAKLHPLNCT